MDVHSCECTQSTYLYIHSLKKKKKHLQRPEVFFLQTINSNRTFTNTNPGIIKITFLSKESSL